VNTVVWVIVAVVVVIGVLVAAFGWDRYRSNGEAAGEPAHPTDEVFTDPSTGKTMRVWYNPSTGEREYRPD
jgi:hypothetical protein